MSAVQHFQNLVVVKGFLNPFSNCFEFLEINDSVFILVENGEDSSQTVFSLSLSNSATDGIEELFETDWFVLVSKASDETQNEGISFVDSQFFECL